MDDSQVNTFVQSYRDALKANYDATVAQAEQQKDNDYATIMGAANSSGAQYSNFPSRTKVQYNTSTYLPALSKAYSTYQTGLNTLRSNTAKYKNNIQALEAATADLNKDVYNQLQFYQSGSS